MAPVQSLPDMSSAKHETASKEVPPCHQGWTPPDSPATGSTTPHAIVEDLKHLFEDVLIDLTNREPPNTPVFLDHSQSGPDMDELKQLLVKLIRDGYSSGVSAISTKPSQSFSANNEQDVIDPVTDGVDRSPVICTTPDDFKSFEIWASNTHFKTIFETYDPVVVSSIPFFQVANQIQLGQRSMQVQDHRA